MPRIDRRSFQYHGIELYELMSEQAKFQRNARRAQRQFAVTWLVNRLAIVAAVGVVAKVIWTIAGAASRIGGLGLAVVVGLAGAVAAALLTRRLRSSWLVEAGRSRERAARSKVARRQAALHKVNESLRARAPKVEEPV